MFLKARKNKQVLPGSPAFIEPGSFGSRSYGMKLDSMPNGKIVVFGLPKSGNVWLVSLLADYLDLKAIDPYVDVDRMGAGMCHRPYSKEISDRNDFIHGVYLIRDLRDVIVSYFHHTQREDWRTGFPHFHYDTIQQFYFGWFLPRVSIAHDVDNHAHGYAMAGLPIVKYEELYDDPEQEFIRLIKRLGFSIDLKAVSSVIERNHISTLRATGKELDVKVPKEHFRKGGYGGYLKELPINVLKHINQRFDKTIRDFGYDL